MAGRLGQRVPRDDEVAHQHRVEASDVADQFRAPRRARARLAGAPPSTGHPPRALDYGRLEPRVDEPREVQDECLEAYEEYETEEPERAVAERVTLAAELAEEARLEELDGAPGPQVLEEEAEQRDRDRALAAEETDLR